MTGVRLVQVEGSPKARVVSWVVPPRGRTGGGVGEVNPGLQAESLQAEASCLCLDLWVVVLQ